MRVTALLITVALSVGLQAQTASDLFQKALTKERIDGEPDAAIALYERIVGEVRGDRAVVAKALLQLGRLSERLGRPVARAAYERVLREYADQTAVADEARARIAALAPLEGATRDQAPLTPRVRQLWAGAAAGQFLGSPSPDGRYLSLVDWATLNLVLFEPLTDAVRPLTRDGARAGGSPYWSRISPDGTKVAFTFFPTTGAADLRLVRVGHPDVRILYRNEDLEYVHPFDWSPDGTHLLVLLASPDRSHRIALIALADGTATVLKSLDWRAPSAMSFSPDGRWIAYDAPQSERGHARDVRLLAIDGTRETHLVEHPADDFLLGWAPGRRTVLFGSDRTGAPAMWAIEAGEGLAIAPPSFVRGDLGWQVHPMGFTRAGTFVYFVASTLSDVYTSTLETESAGAGDVESVAGPRAGAYHSGDWSPSGGSLALMVQRPGSPDRRLFLRRADDGAERELRPDLAMFTWPRWAPDGGSLLLSGEDRRNRKGFFRVDASTGETTELVREAPGIPIGLRAEWAPDGQSLYYTRRETACTCVVRRELATGRDVVVDRMTPRSTLVLLAPSPDGRWLAVATRDDTDTRTELRLVSLAGAAGRVLAEGDDLRWFNFVAWMPDSRDVLFGRQVAGGSRVAVWRVAIAGGAPRVTGLAAENLRDLRVHPDGRRVLFAAGQNRGELWAMEHFLRGQP